MSKGPVPWQGKSGPRLATRPRVVVSGRGMGGDETAASVQPAESEDQLVLGQRTVKQWQHTLSTECINCPTPHSQAQPPIALTMSIS